MAYLMYAIFYENFSMMDNLKKLIEKGISAAAHGRMKEAEDFFKSAMNMDCSKFDASYNLIKLFHIQKRYKEGIDIFNLISSKIPLGAMPSQVVYLIGDCASNQHDLLIASKCFEILHNSHPEHIDTVCRLSSILIESGQLIKSRSVLERTNSVKENDPNVLTQLAITESELGNYQGAEIIHRQLIGRYGQQFLSNFNFALFLSMLGREEEAIDFLHICLSIVPGAPEAISKLEQLTKKGESVLSVIYSYIELSQWDKAVNALADAKKSLNEIYYWAAVCEIPENFISTLVDVDNVIPFKQVQCVQLFSNLDDRVIFLSNLEAYINEQESLIWNRAGKPTRNGKQSHELLKDSKNSYVQKTNLKLMTEIKKYLTQHEFVKKMLANENIKSELSGWGVVLSNGGFQKKHIHPEATISGVLYIKLSGESMSKDKMGGNLLFPSVHGTLNITPEEGMAVIFPSYMAHETVPLRTNHARMCIAFNLI